MKVYLPNNVFEESLNRIRRIYDEFDKVYVSVSGGKDSTVVFNLAKIVAREKGKLPLHVLFLDQEAEWASTVEEIKMMMYDPDVIPYWYQVPIRLFNATSPFEDWLYCWKPGEEWLREKDPISIKENDVGTDRFHDFFYRRAAKEAEEKNILMAELTGMRTEESPARFAGLTQTLKYKDISWGRKNQYSKNTFVFHPIYDWSYLDVWKSIHDNGWPYNTLYDKQYQHGVYVSDMRVSNLHHETAVHALFILQEIEPDTYDKLTRRLRGVDMAGKMGREDYFVKELPFMFKDWREYRDYLLENLIQSPDKQESFRSLFDMSEGYLEYGINEDSMFKSHVNAILANDFEGTKIHNSRHRWNIQKRDYLRAERRKIEHELSRQEVEGTAD